MPEGPWNTIKSAALVGAVAAVVGLCFWLQWWWTQQSMDVSVYWEAGDRMRQGGTELYAPSQDPSNSVGYYIYPPLFATLFAPLTWLPRWVGYAFWTFAQLGLLAAAFEGARRLAAVARRRDFALFVIAALWGAIWLNLQEGQVNLLVGALIAWGLLMLERGKSWRGALLLAAAIHVKIVPVVLLPLLLLQGRWRAALAVLAGSAVLWLVPLVFTVPNEGLAGGMQRNLTLTREYADIIAAPRLKTQDTDSLGGARAPNNGLPAVWKRYFGDGERLSLELTQTAPLVKTIPGPVGRFGGLALATLLGIATLIVGRLRRETPPQRSLAAGLTLLAGMMGNLLFWPHHMCASMVLLAGLWALSERKHACLVLAGALLFLAWLPINDRVPALAWMGAVGTPTLAIVGLWAWGLWVLWRSGNAPLQGHDSRLYSAPDEQAPARSSAA